LDDWPLTKTASASKHGIKKSFFIILFLKAVKIGGSSAQFVKKMVNGNANACFLLDLLANHH